MAGCSHGILFQCQLPVLPGCPWVVKPWGARRIPLYYTLYEFYCGEEKNCINKCM